MRHLKRRLKRALTGLIWFIIKLPFKLVYLFFRWLLSNKRVTSGGYVIKRSKSGKDQYEHRSIAAEVLGRRLAPWEVVHHINGQRDDNRPSNLCVMPGLDHDRYHKWYDLIYKTYGRYPRRTVQLKKLKGSFNGIFLVDSDNKSTRTG